MAVPGMDCGTRRSTLREGSTARGHQGGRLQSTQSQPASQPAKPAKYLEQPPSPLSRTTSLPSPPGRAPLVPPSNGLEAQEKTHGRFAMPSRGPPQTCCPCCHPSRCLTYVEPTHRRSPFCHRDTVHARLSLSILIPFSWVLHALFLWDYVHLPSSDFGRAGGASLPQHGCTDIFP